MNEEEIKGKGNERGEKKNDIEKESGRRNVRYKA